LSVKLIFPRSEERQLRMEVFDGIENVQRSLRNPVLTIGNFDGVHRGHQTLFRKAKEWAVTLSGESVVITFHPHPLQILAPGQGPLFITSHERKLELIALCGIDVAVVVPFSKQFARMSARDFVKVLLVDKIGAKAIIVGEDYRFGYSREGDIDFLQRMGDKYRFRVETVSGVEMDGTVVSSTLIRQFIQEGDVREANRLLGRPYEIAGVVIPGHQRGGRLLGFPTANISLSGQAPPKPGVYVVEVKIGDGTYGGAANVGYNPTFGGNDLSIEVFVFDFDENIYEKLIRVYFVERLRDEKRFSGPEELTLQIRKDVEQARRILIQTGRSLLFKQ
jgi:riboflavin kinase / FMN adenylyltransferase